jgi:hypothetical protein
VPLADWAALNAPQPTLVVLPQARDHATPPFFESLVTVAVTERFPPAVKEAGVGFGVVLSAIDGVVLLGGGVLELELELPPHATNVAIEITVNARRTDLENVILEKVALEEFTVHLPQGRCGVCFRPGLRVS